MALGAPLDAPSLFLSYIVNTARAALEQIEATGAALPADEDRDLALHSLDYALKLPDAWSVTGSLLTALAPKMERAGYRHDWIAYLDAGIDASQQCGDQATEAELRLQKGILHQLLAEYHEADGEYVLSEAGFAALPDQRALARVLNRRAFVARRQGRHEDAERLAAAAMALLAADDAELGYTYQVLGTIAYDRMQWQEAARCFRLSLDLLRQGDDRRLQGWAHSNLGLALWQTGDLVGPTQQGGEFVGEFGLDHRDLTEIDLAGAAVDGDHIAFLDDLVADVRHPLRGADHDAFGTGDAGLAHATGNHGGVRGLATATGENALGSEEAVDVFGLGLFAHQDHGFTRPALALGAIGVEHGMAGGGSRRCRQPLRHGTDFGGGVETREQHLFKRVGIDP